MPRGRPQGPYYRRRRQQGRSPLDPAALVPEQRQGHIPGALHLRSARRHHRRASRLIAGGAALSNLGTDAAYDVAIVGARVAGALLAILLGQQGRRVLLIDRATFPSDTFSTHFFRAPALRAFRQAGVLDEVLAGAPHLAWAPNVVDGIVFPEPVTRPEDFPFYLCLRRIVLDDILARRARRPADVPFPGGAA